MGFIIGDNDIKTLDSKKEIKEFDKKLFDHSALLVVNLDNGKRVLQWIYNIS